MRMTPLPRSGLRDALRRLASRAAAAGTAVNPRSVAGSLGILVAALAVGAFLLDSPGAPPSEAPAAAPALAATLAADDGVAGEAGPAVQDAGASGAGTEADMVVAHVGAMPGAAVPETLAPGTSVPEAAAPAAPGGATDTVRVRRGDTMAVILRRVGFDGGDIHDASAALGRILDPRRILPGDVIHLERSPDNGLMEMVVEQGRTEYVVARSADGPFEARTRERPFMREVRHARGVIESSLYISASRERVPPAIIHKLIALYSWSVDFQREIRSGDTFELMYERLYDPEGSAEQPGEILFARLALSGDSKPLFRFEVDEGVFDHFDDQGRTVRRTLLRTPIDGARLSSGYGRRKHPILGYNAMHRGVDFAAPTGTPFYAAGDGVVTYRGRNGAYGNYLRIRHNSSYSTAYAHLSRFRRGVTKGSRVRQGQVIGYVGSTGRSTGPHLHYEVLLGGRQINPLKLKMKPGAKLAGDRMERFGDARAALLDQLGRLRADAGGRPAGPAATAAKLPPAR